MISRKAVSISLAVLLCSTCCLAGAPGRPDSDRSAKKIVFVAGPKDHGSPGAHEYEKDLQLLKKCLDTSPNVEGITTQIVVGQIPKNIRELRGAAATVIHSSGDSNAKETHAVFPTHNRKSPEATYSKTDLRRIGQLDRLMKRGVGIVILHYSLIVENPRSRDYLLDWIGGYHRSGQSQVKIDRSEAVPATPKHPILGGVGPWTTDHEYYFNQYFGKADKRVVPILTSMLPSDKPQRQVIAWAVEREGGGRGFAFTGCHYHKNMQIDDYRRMLLNAIVWTAKVPVPKEGVVSSVSSP
ncbi:MAG: ThuA domain-containing protein [Planctomycetota bacterium]